MWKIRNFPGGKEFLLRAKFGLPSVAAEDEQTGRMPPIRVNYEVSASSPNSLSARLCKETLKSFRMVMSRRLNARLAFCSSYAI